LLFDDRPNRIPSYRSADKQQSGTEHQLDQQNNQVMFLPAQLATWICGTAPWTSLG
jgi:hypothetical protein